MASALLLALLAFGQPADGEPTLAGQAPAAHSGEALEPAKVWGGVFRDDALREFGTDSGIVTDPGVFEAIWEAWRPGEDRPEIDFSKFFVLVATIDGPNRMFMRLSRDDQGNVAPEFGGTKIGGPGFGYLIAVVPREGVNAVGGAPLPEPPPTIRRGSRPDHREFARVTVRGQLETGVVAIGGETTGTVVRANGMTFELVLGQPNLAARAEGLNGRPVIVTGDLNVKQGVETGPRFLVDVTRIDPAPERRPRRPAGR